MERCKISFAAVIACALTTGAIAQSFGPMPPEPTAATSPGAVVTTPSLTTADTSLAAANADPALSAADKAMLDSVVSALTTDPALQGARLNATVSEGVVTISGTTRNVDQAVRAKSVAAAIPGARVETTLTLE